MVNALSVVLQLTRVEEYFVTFRTLVIPLQLPMHLSNVSLKRTGGVESLATALLLTHEGLVQMNRRLVIPQVAASCESFPTVRALMRSRVFPVV
jgi:hypothetical protein